ncbi:Fatty acid desaturase [Thiothrix eikelboomii]|uniref:Fatty acid desaturase n=1 Tax=Thiothrix eikelboomii TaxID=92487 RepID=A0A1T4XWF5_9GAMM|nr:fatty acid desaturase [Thiothrix eikelboomii]SKA93840.1 Fatty acid desaturase [Thiothrix eikelboomii]
MQTAFKKIEYLTLSLLLGTYLSWGLLTSLHALLPLWLVIPLLTVLLSFQGSLQHEVIHYHPLPWQSVNEYLASPPLVLYLPFIIYRDTHRQHHVLEHISDPSQDPESAYVTAAQWAAMPIYLQQLRRINNTLLGRFLLGPALGITSFLWAEFKKLKAGDKYTIHAWLSYLPWLLVVVAWLVYWQFPLGWYVVACYFSYSLTAIRIFAEHQAVAIPEQRTVVVESNGVLSYLFLQNNLHAVHHKYPALPWYKLRAKYLQEREAILEENGNYCLASYFELFKRYAWKPKEDVVHPL